MKTPTLPPFEKSSLLKSTCDITYEFKPEQLTHIIAADLGVSPDKVSVEFVIEAVGYDCRDNDAFKKVTKVRVTVRP